MALSIDQAEQLKTLGFSLPNSQLERHQQIWWFKDAGPFEGEQYCAGGRLAPNAPCSISPIVPQHGLWLPTGPELLLWLELKEFSLDIKIDSDMSLSSVTAQHKKGCNYHAHAATIESALSNQGGYFFCPLLGWKLLHLLFCYVSIDILTAIPQCSPLLPLA